MGLRGLFLLVCALGCQDPDRSERHRPLATAVGSEIEIDAPVARPSDVPSLVDGAASDGSRFLLVWREDANRLFAGRFRQNGTRVEPVGHALGVSSDNAEVAFDGSGFVLVWDAGDRIYASLMSAAGDLLGTPLLVAETVEADGDLLLRSPAVAVSSSRILVVWVVARNSFVNPARGRLFDLSLAPVGAAFDIASLAVGGTAAGSSGNNFFVAWEDFADDAILGTRVTSAGAVVDGSGIRISPVDHLAFGPPRVAFGGGQYLVNWRREATSRIYGRRYQANGVSLDAVPFEFTAGANDSPLDPGHRVAFDGARFVVSWIDDREGPRYVYSSRLGLDGALDPAGGARVDTSAATAPTATASAGGVTLLARRSSFALTDAEGTTLTTQPIRFAWRYNAQSAQALCATSAGHLAVWQDDRVPSGIHAAPLSAAGTPRAPSERLSASLADPAVACGDGGINLVAWRADGDVLALRVDDEGNPIDLAPIDLGDANEGTPAVASSGSEFMVVWSTGAVYGRRVVAADGSLPDAGPVPIANAAGGQYLPAVAFGDGVYLAVWGDSRDGIPAVYGARIDAGGDVLDVAGVPIAADLNTDEPPVVAYGPAGFLVAWPGTGGRVYTRVIGLDGAPIGPAAVALDSLGSAPRLDATWGGASFALVASGDGGPDIVMTRVDEAGVSLSTPGQVVAVGGVEPVQNPVVVSSGPGDFVVAFERSVLYGGRATPRVRLVDVSLDPAATPCAGPVLCISGHCVDGVCCDAACGGGAPGDCQACSVMAGAAADGACGPVAAGPVCRPAAGDCDVAEVCDGASLDCPADELASEGADCSDGDGCTTGEACAAGACAGGAPVDCSSSNPCEVGSCDADSGGCVVDPAEDGTPCPGGSCQSGSCVASPGPPDGGPADGGPADGGPADAGTPERDAGGAVDAGPVRDAGQPADGDSGGCGCRALPSAGEGAATSLAWLALALFLRRRRR